MARYHPGSAGGIRERIDQIFSEAGRLIFLLQPVRTSIIETHFYSQIMSLGLSDSAVDFAISAYGAAAMAGSVIGGMRRHSPETIPP